MIYVSKFAGGSVGEKIIAADTYLGASPGVIYVDEEGVLYGIAAVDAGRITIHPGHVLQFGPGHWTTTGVGTSCAIMLSSNTSVRGAGLNTVLDEPTVGNAWAIFSVLDYGNVTVKNVHISDLKIQGTGSHGATSADQTIKLGNLVHGSVERVHLERTNAIGVQAGGVSSNTGAVPQLNVINATNRNPIVVTTSTPHDYETGEEVTIAGVGGNTAANGKWIVTYVSPTSFSIAVAGNGIYASGGTAGKNGHAIDVRIADNSFSQVGFVNIALTNGKDISITNNIMRDAGNPANGNPSFVDVEPNTGTDWISDFRITNNTIGGEKDVFFSNGIVVYGNGTARTPGIISNNTIRGPIMANGIFLIGSNDILVANNNIQSTAQTGIWFSGARNSRAVGNILKNVGGGGIPAMDFTSSVSCEASGNQVSGSTTTIKDAGSTNNAFLNNTGFSFTTTSASTLIVDRNGIAFANLPTARNGSEIFCTNCTEGSDPCTGAGRGSRAKRLNGRWSCRN
ncbi:MAG TPA: right-handed parallel beta-helix repeat-containing protein [Pyrinomonadaceae bacterium]